MDAAFAGSPELSIRLPDDEEELCRRYGRAKVLFGLAEFLLLLVTLSGLTLTHEAALLLLFADPQGTPDWLGHLVFLVLVGFIVRCVLLPVHFMNEYWLDRRFGLGCQTAASWFWEWLCRSTVLGLATVVLLFPVAETLRWWPWLA